MTKINRTFRLDQELSRALDKICVRHGDKTYHIENALRAYLPAAQIDNVTIPSFVKPKSVEPEDSLLFDGTWEAYGKKGNKKTSKTKFNRLNKMDKQLLVDSIPAYILSTPDKQYRKNLETYINQECWNDEVIPNAENRPNGASGANQLSAVDRVRARNESDRAAERGHTDNMADVNGGLRQHPGQAVRGSDAGFVGETIDGDYTRTNQSGAE